MEDQGLGIDGNEERADGKVIVENDREDIVWDN